MLLGSKIEIVKMREGLLCVPKSVLYPSHMLEMVSSSGVTRSLGSRGEAIVMRFVSAIKSDNSPKVLGNN